MDFDTFINAVIKELSQQLGDSYTVNRHKAGKNNGITRHAVMISDGIRQTIPCYFMENYYELFQKPEDIKIIAGDIIKSYQKEPIPDSLFDYQLDGEQILEQVLFRIVNTDMNTELLKNAPHHDIPGLGLSMLFYLIVNAGTNGTATILLQNSHLEKWGIDETKLLAYAWHNTPLAMAYTITSLDELLSGHTVNTANSAAPPMYAITNTQRIYGAGCILYPGVLEDVSSRLHSDFYILPSSIHETIAVPADGLDKDQAEAYKKIVTEINRTELLYDDILTDNVYYYSRKDHRLIAAA